MRKRWRNKVGIDRIAKSVASEIRNENEQDRRRRCNQDGRDDGDERRKMRRAWRRRWWAGRRRVGLAKVGRKWRGTDLSYKIGTQKVMTGMRRREH